MEDKEQNIENNESSDDTYEWLYSNIVKDHFFNPRNFLTDDKVPESDGMGTVGNPTCGDMMMVWIKVDEKSQKIKECKWRTFGCASAIASTSMMSVMVTEKGGMSIDKALQLKPEQIVDRLEGLPDRKFHCSVLGQDALKEAINDYQSKNKRQGK